MSNTKLRLATGELAPNTLPVWKTPYNHDTNLESDRTALYCNPNTEEGKSRTKQEFKEESDINVILDRFMKTGNLPAITLPEHFADLSNRTTYFDAACAAADANELFYMLPAKKRAEFLNDPTRWADEVVAALDRGDRDALKEMGISVPDKPQEPAKGDPLPGDTPARQPPAAASGASGTPPGDPKGGDAPKPPSDKGKNP